jgi:hypothetical protein
MKTFEIDYELPNRRAIVKGEYSDLRVDDPVIIVDNAENEYNAVVETRVAGGAVVRVTGYR